jgi:hypothetical protein
MTKQKRPRKRKPVKLLIFATLLLAACEGQSDDVRTVTDDHGCVWLLHTRETLNGGTQHEARAVLRVDQGNCQNHKLPHVAGGAMP